MLSVILEAKNNFLCITNERVIKHYGILSNKFVHYSIKNIGNLAINSTFFDKKGPNGSVNLIITVKDFHSNLSGINEVLTINSLNNPYEAYKIISSSIAEKNNDALRIKSL